MADNVSTQSGTLASVPATTTYAADLISSVYYFRQKVALGADGTFTADVSGRDVGSGDGAMYVDPRAKAIRLAPDTQPVVSTSPAYTAKDAIGGLLSWSNFVRVSGGSALIQTATLVDRDQELKGIDLALFRASITAPTDNAIFAPSDTEMEDFLGVIPFTAGSYADFSTNAGATVTSVGLEVVLAATTLYGVLVSRGAPTYTATSDIRVFLTAIQD